MIWLWWTAAKGKSSPSMLDLWRWTDAKMADIDAALGIMLQGSSARTEKDRLVIRSANRMLVENVKGDELTRAEGRISEALGFAVRIVIEAEMPESNAGELSEVEKFLVKARELCIDVTVKKQ